MGLVNISTSVWGRTILVPAEAPTIQDGIDAATDGDVVLVAAGVYAGDGNKNLNLQSKDVAVRSEGGAEVTIIDCEGNGRGFYLIGPLTEAAVIEGFTIRNGDVTDDPVGGGAIFIAGGAPSILGCHFVQNRAAGLLQNGGGGAISVYNASPTIDGCEFLDNIATGSGAVGGGLAAHNSHIRGGHCRFEGNAVSSTDGLGGGLGIVWVGAAPQEHVAVIEGCQFNNNEATHGGGAFLVHSALTNSIVSFKQAISGGGVWALLSEIEGCSFEENSSSAGGGASVLTCSVLRSVFTANVATDEGGGVYCTGRTNTFSQCVLAAR